MTDDALFTAESADMTVLPATRVAFTQPGVVTGQTTSRSHPYP